MLKIRSSVTALLLLMGSSAVAQMHMQGNIYQSVLPKEATLVQKGEGRDSCALCGMNLVKFYKTSHIATVDGEKKQYCSLHAIAKELLAGKVLKDIEVVDVTSLKFIPVSQAHYVVGSSKPATMSHIASKYAFAKLSDAKKFQAKFGGKIMDFGSALKVANEDFKK